MRIAHVGVEIVPSENGAFVGGLVKNVATLSREQVRHGHDVHVFTTDIAQSLVSVRAPAYGTVHTVPVAGRYGSPRFATAFLRGAARLLLAEDAKEPFDVIHVHSAYASLALLGRRIRRLRGKKVFSLYSPNLRLVPGHDCGRRTWFRGRWITVRALRTFDAVVVPSENMESLLRDEGIDASRIARVPPLLDPAMLQALPARDEARRRLGLPEDRPVLLFLGNYSPWKGVEVLLRSLELVRQKHPDVLLLTAWGEPYQWTGNNRSDVLALVDQLGLRPLLRQVGIVGDVRLALRAADALVSPFLCTCKVLDSPLSILEGMACGTAVVATTVGGIPELVGEGSRGTTVPPGAPAALAQALDALLSDPTRARRTADEAAEWVQSTFRADTVAGAMDRVYTRLGSVPAVAHSGIPAG